MSSIGNDIVSLNARSQRAAEKKFYQKILSADEFSLRGNIPTAIFTWLAWSVKESVFKCMRQTEPLACFSALKMNIEQITWQHPGHCTCTVYARGQHYYTQIALQKEYIHSVACAGNEWKDIHRGVAVIDSDEYAVQSASVRSFALQQLSTVFPLADLRIEKTASGIPVAWSNQDILPVAISLSHDDCFISFAFVKNVRAF